MDHFSSVASWCLDIVKMKFVITLLAVVAVSLGSAFPQKSLGERVSSLRQWTPFGIKEDLDDFLALIPKDQVLNIVLDYLANDEEVQETFAYMQSEDFKQLLTEIESIPEYRNVSFNHLNL